MLFRVIILHKFCCSVLKKSLHKSKPKIGHIIHFKKILADKKVWLVARLDTILFVITRRFFLSISNNFQGY